MFGLKRLGPLLNKKVPVKIEKVRLLKDGRQFSVWQLIVFVLAFGVIGYGIYHSFAATTTTTTTSTTGPYASPFGDLSCQKIVNGVLTTVPNCFCDPSVSTCIGSCVKSSVTTTGGCRPMTMKHCTDTATPYLPTLWPSQIDQGVDYQVYPTDSNCTYYNNPNPKDTASSAYFNSKSDTRVYAMGNGIITCLIANPGHMQNITLSQKCRGGGSNLGSGAGTWLVYKLTGGTTSQGRGLKIYVSEGCVLSRNAISNALTMTTLHRRWKVNDSVTRNSVLCEISPGTIEIGWANQGRTPYLNRSNGTPEGGTFKNEVQPAAYGCFYKHYYQWGIWSTPWGNSFNHFILKYDSDRFSGKTGPDAFYNCPGFPKQAKYKITW